jgi:hypothetical protein
MKAWRVVGEKSRRVRFTLGGDRGRRMNVKDDDWGWSLLGQSLSLMPDGGKVLATLHSFCGPVAVALSQRSLIRRSYSGSAKFQGAESVDDGVIPTQVKYIGGFGTCNLLRVGFNPGS